MFTTGLVCDALGQRKLKSFLSFNSNASNYVQKRICVDRSCFPDTTETLQLRTKGSFSHCSKTQSLSLF